jgi:hypothetical protein
MTISTSHARDYSPGRNPIVLAAALLVTNLFALSLWTSGHLQVQENNFLELAQCVFLALICGVSSVRAWHRAKTSLDLKFLLHAGLALLSYSFLLREVDVDQIGVAPAWGQLEQALRLFGAALWCGLLIFMALRIRALWSQRAIMLKMPMVVLAALSGVLLLAGWPFDKQVFSVLPSLTSEFIEEMLEVNGFMVLFFGSLAD